MPPATFNANTIAEDAATEFATSISGKVVIITGVSLGGLGGEAARVIAKYGARLVVLAGRSLEKLDEAEALILKETPSAKLRKLVIDLASLASVRKAAAEVNAYSEPVDVLINNAGIMAGPYALTPDGFESQFGTNHLGPFLFTTLIHPRLLASSSPRVVNVSSWGHHFSDIRYEDPGFSSGEKYDKWQSYGQSKTANILFAVGIAQKWGIEAFSLHPGAIMTNLGRFLSVEDQIAMGFIDAEGNRSSDEWTWKSLEEGVSTHIVAAFDPSLSAQRGSYLVDAQIHNDLALPYALDKGNAEKLWTLSEKMVEVSATNI